MGILNNKVLVLNQTFEPINITSVRRILGKILKEQSRIMVEEYYDHELKFGKHSIKVPSVVRLNYYLKVKKVHASMTSKKMKIFMRDKFICWYCQTKLDPKYLTVDHVIPKSRGGETSSNNLITACRWCNCKKNDRLPEELGIEIPKSLLNTNINFNILVNSISQNPNWKKYLYA